METDNPAFYGEQKAEPVIPVLVSRLAVALANESLYDQLSALETMAEMLLAAGEVESSLSPNTLVLPMPEGLN